MKSDFYDTENVLLQSFIRNYLDNEDLESLIDCLEESAQNHRRDDRGEIVDWCDTPKFDMLTPKAQEIYADLCDHTISYNPSSSEIADFDFAMVRLLKKYLY